MGFQSSAFDVLTHDDHGTPLFPDTDGDWRTWVNATAVRNYLLDDTLVDWLEMFGRTHGFCPDCDLDGYDPRTDFKDFIYRKATAFEAAVVAH